MADKGRQPPTEEEGKSRSSSSQTDMPVEVDVQALIEGKRELEEKVDQLTKELRRQQRYNAKCRKMFLPQFCEWERMDKELRRLRKEEGPLPERKDKLQQSLREVSSRNVEKVEEVRRLTERISKLMLAEDDGREVDAKKMFPEEIWEEFFGKLTDPRDLWNCYNTCCLFQKILYPWKSTWAFEKALPYLFPHLSGRDLLECRSVSTGWKKVVDEFLQDHPSLRPHNEDTCNPRQLPFVNPQMEKGLVNHFNFGEGEFFMNDPNHHPVNLEDPDWTCRIHQHLALGKSARFSIGMYGVAEDERNEEIWRKVYSFLDTFGEHIWYVSCSVIEGREGIQAIPGSPWAKQQMIQFLVSDIFELAPNLRRLCVESLPEVTQEDFIGFPIDVRELPSAPNLESVEVDFNAFAANQIALALALRHHRQLGRLKMDKPPWSYHPHTVGPLHSLTELHFYGDNLNNLESVAWIKLPKLSKLGLSFSQTITNGEAVQEPLKLTDLLQELKDVLVATRVTTLRLDGSIYKLKSDANQEDQEGAAQPAPVLLMPSTLKTLELENTGGIFPHPDYQKLLPHFPHLENLNVFYKDNSKIEVVLRPKDKLEEGHDGQPPTEVEREKARLFREREVAEVNKFLYTGEMYKSNIWELLPRLKVFTFQWEVYTRGGYEEYCSRKKPVDKKN